MSEDGGGVKQNLMSSHYVLCGYRFWLHYMRNQLQHELFNISARVEVVDKVITLQD